MRVLRDIAFFANTPGPATNISVDKYYARPARPSTTNRSELRAEAWAAGLLLEDAVKAGGLTRRHNANPRAEITTGLESLKGDTLDGWPHP